MAGKYFNLQFNRNKTGEAEFEGKLRKMAKDNNLTLAETVIALVMAVDHFKVSYNVDLDLGGSPEEKSKGSFDKKLESELQKAEPQIQHSVLDALLN